MEKQADGSQTLKDYRHGFSTKVRTLKWWCGDFASLGGGSQLETLHYLFEYFYAFDENRNLLIGEINLWLLKIQIRITILNERK